MKKNQMLRAFLAALLWPVSRNSLIAANVGEGTHANGLITYKADATTVAENLLVKIGSDENHVALCGTSDVPLGPALDNVDAIEDDVAVSLLGATSGTLLGVASGAIAAGDAIVAGASGTVRTCPTAGGTYNIIGRALKATADAGTVEYAPCLPTQRVVT
jgi:hypothetical protein